MTRPGDRAPLAESTAPSMPFPAALPASPSLETAGADDLRFTRSPRSYRVRGLARNLSAESLKVTLRLSAGEHLHLDTLDLYQARQRDIFVKAAALELGVAENVIAGDLSALVLALEPLPTAGMRLAASWHWMTSTRSVPTAMSSALRTRHRAA